MNKTVTIFFPRVIRQDHDACSKGMRETHVHLRKRPHVAPDAHTASRRYVVSSRRVFIPFGKVSCLYGHSGRGFPEREAPATHSYESSAVSARMKTTSMLGGVGGVVSSHFSKKSPSDFPSNSLALSRSLSSVSGSRRTDVQNV